MLTATILVPGRCQELIHCHQNDGGRRKLAFQNELVSKVESLCGSVNKVDNVVRLPLAVLILAMHTILSC